MTTQPTKKTVADLTIAELKEVIRETVAEVVADLVIDPDEGLELNEEFAAGLEQSITEAAAGQTTPAVEVYRRLEAD